MNYALSVVALLAAVIGVVGNTWKMGRPTITGWVVIGLALVAFMLTVGKYYTDHHEQRKIAAIACQQVVRGVHLLILPFPVLLADVIRTNTIPDPNTEERNRRVRELIVANDEQVASRIMKSINELPMLLDYANVLNSYFLDDDVSVLRDGSVSGSKNPLQWKDIFERWAMKGIEALDVTLSSYRSVMTFKEIDAAQQLRNVWLTQRIENLHRVPGDSSLGDFLKLDEKNDPQNQGNIYEEFLHASEFALKVCSDAA